jgi:hypothetical protein
MQEDLENTTGGDLSFTTLNLESNDGAARQYRSPSVDPRTYKLL